MQVLLSHPTGNAFVRSAAIHLAKAGLLYNFTTTIASFPNDILDQLSSLKPFSEIQRRRFDSTMETHTKQWPWFEIGRLIAMKAGLSKLTTHESGVFSVDSVYKNLDSRIAYQLNKLGNNKPDAIYAYEDGAVQSFRKAKELGIIRLYDLPIGYWRSARRLLEPELERWPEWISTMTGFLDSASKLARKDEELSLADRIFVASKFTADTLRDFPGELAPVKVIPYGFPPIGPAKTYPTLKDRPLRLLFVGGLSQRKGIADLFAAVDAFGKSVELTVIGRKATDVCSPLNNALTRHQWIPSLPHEKVIEIMRQHDVLIFPSLFEGFGLVVTEAMSQGTPVITTNRTAGPDLIEHGKNGWLIDAGSTQALIDAIEELINSPESIAEVGKAAQETASFRPWEVYGTELVAAILELN